MGCKFKPSFFNGITCCPTYAIRAIFDSLKCPIQFFNKLDVSLDQPVRQVNTLFYTAHIAHMMINR